eukprot:767412-Hanusia_phi.AAC.6
MRWRKFEDERGEQKGEIGRELCTFSEAPGDSSFECLLLEVANNEDFLRAAMKSRVRRWRGEGSAVQGADRGGDNTNGKEMRGQDLTEQELPELAFPSCQSV